MLTKTDICAVIVTYNCDESIFKNVDSLQKQVDSILIIDNGSKTKSLILLSEINKLKNIEIIQNDANEGVAFALNQGLQFAYENNYKLLLTMDQDSLLLEDAISKMLNIMNENKFITSLGPNYNSIKKSLDSRSYEVVDVLITSGNLTYVHAIREVGGYNNSLFIDSVDFDFSLSLKSRNNKLALVYDAGMLHDLGDEEEIKFLFVKYKTRTHSPIRYYYMCRNHYYIIKKYFFKNTRFCIKKEMNLWRNLFKVFILYPNKRENHKMIFRGLKDAIQNKYGPFN